MDINVMEIPRDGKIPMGIYGMVYVDLYSATITKVSNADKDIF